VSEPARSARIALRQRALVALLVGFACMAAELTAVRLLAPHFGDSAYVWTNVIGVILVALAIGALVGGRLAATPRAAAHTRTALVVAGVALAVVPYATGALGGWLVPAELPLDAAMPALVRGSFVATVLAFGVPLGLLGAVSPLLVAASIEEGVPPGRAAGGLGAAGTFGSLLGTFLATHWLVPTLGCRIAMTVAAAVLAVAALLVPGRGGRRAAGLVLLATALAGLGHGGPLRSALPGRELLAEVESRSQFLQVVARDVGGTRRTELVINEGLDSFHSLALAGSVFTSGAYYDWHAIVPWLVGAGNPPAALRALSLGDAAGTLRAIYAAVWPGAVVDAVDIDAATMALGDVHFPGPKAPGERFAVDGRVFLAQTTRQWHVIHVDAYAHQVYVPAHLASREFFALARQRLLPGGVLACNVGALAADDAVLQAIARTMAAEFGHARAFLIPNTRNALLVAARGEPPDPTVLGRATVTPGLAAADADHWQRVLQTSGDAAGWHALGQAGEVLCDDLPQLDQLLAQSYVAVREVVPIVGCTGNVEPPAAEAAVYRARLVRDWNGVLVAVATSRTATAYLRLQAGDARWALRQLHGAAAEYAAALALQPDPELRGRLQANLAEVQLQLAPIEQAAAVGRRNGWLQLLGAGLLLAALWCAARQGS
jgi:spermidine synthase